MTSVGLTRSERVYLALDGVAGAIGQVHVLRFARPFSAAELRRALRELVGLCPRLRARPRRTLAGVRLEIIPDGPAIDPLFADAFQVVPGGSDGTDLSAALDRLTNQPFDLRRALPIRFWVLDGAPLPTLLFSVHHVACDGRSMIPILDRLLARLHGEACAPLPLDDPSLLPALLPPPGPGSLRARLACLWRGRRARLDDGRADGGGRGLTLVRESGAFAATSARLHTAAVPLGTIKAAARARGCTVTELVVAALATSFAPQARDAPGGGSATVRLSIDLRPLFPAGRRPAIGNYVAAPVLRLQRWRDLEATMADARALLRAVMSRLERREMATPLLLAAVAPWLIPRRLYSWLAAALKRRGWLRQVTLHVSNLGSLDDLNTAHPPSSLAALHFLTPALGPYVGCVGLGDRLHLGVTFPRGEVEPAAIDAALAAFDGAVTRLASPALAY